MTISQIEKRLAAEFPSNRVKLQISVWSHGPVSSIDIFAEPNICVTGCRTILHAIESLKEKLAPVNVGHVEIKA